MKSLDLIEQEKKDKQAAIDAKYAQYKADGGSKKSAVSEPQPTETTQPEDNGSVGKTFTQDEVNKIVSERLARERAKGTAAADPAADKMAEMEAQENLLSCKNYLHDNNLNPAFLDVFPTDRFEDFAGAIEKLAKCAILSRPDGAYDEDQLRAAAMVYYEPKGTTPKDASLRKAFGLS